MGDLGPVLRGYQDGGEADGLVGPLEAPTRPPSALDTEGEGGVAALALQVHTWGRVHLIIIWFLTD